MGTRPPAEVLSIIHAGLQANEASEIRVKSGGPQNRRGGGEASQTERYADEGCGEELLQIPGDLRHLGATGTTSLGPVVVVFVVEAHGREYSRRKRAGDE